jgi:hemolysin activation/secretion protein
MRLTGLKRRLAIGTVLWAALISGGALAQNMDKLPPSLLLNEFLVEGNTVLSKAVIERAVADYLGPDRKLDDVYAAQDALAKEYETAGYVSASVRAVRLDPVDTEWGKAWVVVLQVVEGRVERLKVTGAEYNAPSEVKDKTPSVAEGVVPHFPSLQKDLAKVAGMSDVVVTPVLRPGRDPGTMEVELKVEDKLPLHGWAQLSNEQSPDTTPRRLELGMRYDNLFQAQHSLSLRYISTPLNTDEIKVAALSYSLPFGGGDDRMTLYLVRSDSNVMTDTGTGVVGKGTTFGIRQSKTLPGKEGDEKSGDFERVSYGADFKQLGEVSDATGSKPVRYLPFSVQYIGMFPDGSGRWQLSSTLTSSFSGIMDRKVDCGSGREIDQFDCRRTGATSSFLTWGSSIKREQNFGRWIVQGRLNFQFASSPLLSSEQFYIGGSDSVRGYYQSEAGGDDGANASLEIYTPRLTPESWTWSAKLLAFVDTGWVRTQQPLPGQVSDYRLIGKGLGMRMEFSKHLTGSLDWGRALLPGPRSKDHASRLNAEVKAEF